MIIAVASGKGGTGKTTVAVSLVLSLRGETEGTEGPLFLDCDVEEPNAALFLGPDIRQRQEVGQLVPQVDVGLCNACGRCAEVCQYHALAVVGQKVLVFPELCHGCGSCRLNCPQEAIQEVLYVTGTMERGWADGIEFGMGTMNVGQPMAVPIIRQLKRWMIPTNPGPRPVVLDAPPGTACPVVETMRGAEFVLMVTEPTPFGLHDLRLAVEVARGELGLPVGVVVNRDGVGDEGVDAYCVAEDVPILGRIPLDRRIAEAYSDGVSLVEAMPGYQGAFVALWHRIELLLERSRARQEG